MTVKDLKELLNNLPDDLEIVLQSDAEGNGYSYCSRAEPLKYYEESSWGFVLPIDLMEEELGADWGIEIERYDSLPIVLVLESF